MLSLFYIHSDQQAGSGIAKKSTVKERPDGIIDPTKFNILSGQSLLVQPPGPAPSSTQPNSVYWVVARPARQMFLILSFTLRLYIDLACGCGKLPRL